VGDLIMRWGWRWADDGYGVAGLLVSALLVKDIDSIL
jgi:hypothetical protein